MSRGKPQRHGDTEDRKEGALPPSLNDLTGMVVDCAFAVHSTLGAGLLESLYETCLEHELRKRRLHVRRQVVVPVVYDGLRFEEGFRVDLLVEDAIIVEVKAVERLLPIHDAQLLTYLKLTAKRVGLLINFNVPRIKDGLKRLVH